MKLTKSLIAAVVDLSGTSNVHINSVFSTRVIHCVIKKATHVL